MRIVSAHGCLRKEEQEGQLPPLPSSICAKGKNVLHTDLFPSLLPCEEAFSSVVDSLVQEKFLGQVPDPLLSMV